jgi:hypothetical protein
MSVNIKKVLGLVLPLVVLIVTGYVVIKSRTRLSTRRIISSEVKEICKTRGKLECNGNCVDGFGEDCYFDTTVYNKQDIETGISFSEEAKSKCFGVHSSSVCGDCHNVFELKEDDNFKEVTCEDFFQATEDKNNECNDCIDVVFAGCC